MAKRNLYLKNTPVDEALELFLAALKASPEAPARAPEKIPSAGALGRITAGAILARLCSPSFNAAAMDGIAVVAAATSSAAETTPKRLKPGRDFAPVDTGDPLRAPYDAVIMAEDIEDAENGEAIVRAAAA
ncbi:MAG: hypothetical protein FWE09_03760, partial [Treponema sp.]|nr:hypothetical protein [Treponema sp.]